MKKNRSIAVIIVLIFIAVSCSREQIKPLNVKRNFSGSLWIVRNAIATEDKVDDLLEMIEGSDVKNLFVQVRGRGDAYYNSGIEPKGFDVEKDFDPLSYIISRTRNTDIRIHAWVNVSFVMNAADYPGNPEHILRKHPEWVTYDYKGRPMTDYSVKELEENLAEGFFLDPAIPGVKQYTCSVIQDILDHYDVDGIHLDYIRYPYSGYNTYHKKLMSDFGYNPIAREIFAKKYGFDPITIDREKDSKNKQLFDQFRSDQLTEIVSSIHRIVKQKDPSITVSAAVMPRYDIGRKVYFQDWTSWLDMGYLDLVCVMSYTGSSKTYAEYLDYAVKTGNINRIFMGIMVKEKTSMDTIAEQVKASYNAGMRGYILFSFEHNGDYIERISKIIEYNRYVFMLY